MRTIYIAGAMRGHRCMNYKQFFWWQHEFERSGWRVANPAELDCERMFKGWRFEPCNFEDVLAIDTFIIRLCDGVFFIDGWEHSAGAKKEFDYARLNGVPCYFESDKRNLL